MTSPAPYERRFYALDDGEISGLHFGQNHGPVKLIFLHANGFNGLSYRRVLESLPVHSVSLDLRGHGFSRLPLPDAPLVNFHIFRDDVTEFLRRYIDGPVMIAGHSLGGAVALLVNQKDSSLIRSALILDPPTLPSIWRYFFRKPRVNQWLMENFRYAKKARSRKAIFPSREFLTSRYAKKKLFKNFVPEMLTDYIEGGTRPHKDGIELCCAPEWEARVFLGHDNDIFGAAKTLPQHSRYIIAAEPFASTPSTRLRIRIIMGKDRMEVGAGLQHLFPMEQPDFVTAHITALMKQSGLLSG